MTPDEGQLAHANAQTERIEALARIVAAQQMGLLRDPLGKNLEPSFWSRYSARAQEVLRIINWNAP